jgi:hypothetical protein
MKKTREATKPVPAEAIARRAEQSKDISRHFTQRRRMMEPLYGPTRRLNVDFTADTLDHHYLAVGARQKTG